MSFKVSIVIPCFNEENNLEALVSKLLSIAEKFPDYEILFIDDGSTDDSLSIIEKLCKTNDKIKFVSFSRNFGHQNALKAGLDRASGDCVVTMDADLQHPPSLIEAMVEKWQEGYQVVYTIRKASDAESFLKNMTSSMFYKLINALSEIDLPAGAADFRLIDKKPLQVLKNMQETTLFLRGLVSWIGFSQYSIEYTPSQRLSGKSKYTLKKMLSLAIEGITSFSIKPLRCATCLGLFLSFSSFIYGLYVLYVRLATGDAVDGWTSIIICILMIGGINLIMLGLIGEYVGKVFIESKKRPCYIVSKTNINIL